MKRLFAMALVSLTVSAVLTGSLSAQGAGMGKDMTAVIGKTVVWSPIDVPGFPAGLRIATVVGDPSAAGPYTIRLSFPDGYQFPAHWHPNDENLTVLSGSFQLGMGDKPDPSKLTTYEAGDYLFMPATKPHFGGVKGATVVQLHGQGPFVINLATPAMR
jgi:quercetin dioxygenase-like cupin family protein